MTIKLAWWVLDPPLGQTSAPRATVRIQTTLFPDMPMMPTCLTGHAPVLLRPRKGVSNGWVLVTQIMPYHMAYLHLTPNSMANKETHHSNDNCSCWVCQSLPFHHIFSRSVTCSSGRSCDPVVRTNRVAAFLLGRAKGRGKKNSLCDF